MSSAVGTRRSLLHDVLSQSEVVELGLDGSIDDLPPVATRLIPTCARAVNVFCWGYFLCFWTAVAVVLHHVAVCYPDTLLPGPIDLIFVSVCTALLVGAELGMYCYVKGENALPEGRGPTGGHFAPSASCVVAHFAVSATTRMCAFMELLFLLHTLVLPTPMIICAWFTVSLTTGAVPFLLQLRSLMGYQCRDAFDPLQCSTCIPVASIETLFNRCRSRGAAAIVKGMRLAFRVVRATRYRLARIAGLCAVWVIRRTTSQSPERRVDPFCRMPGNACQTPVDCEAGLASGSGCASECAPPSVPSCAIHKGQLACSAVCDDTRVEIAHTGGDREGARATTATCRASTTQARRLSWADQIPGENLRGEPYLVLSGRSDENRTRDSSASSVRVTPSDLQGTLTDLESASRGGSWVFISPRQALELTNCLLFLDLPTLSLHVKANFLPLEQLETHEFLTSLVSLVRLYSGDCCMLMYLTFGLCTFGANILFILLLVFLLLKLKSSCCATILAHVAAVFRLWDVD